MTALFIMHLAKSTEVCQFDIIGYYNDKRQGENTAMIH